jgi:hypothetical protein
MPKKLKITPPYIDLESERALEGTNDRRFIDLSKWFDVAKKLPPENVEILVFISVGDGYIRNAIFSKGSGFMKWKKGIFWENNNGYGFTVSCHPTHWTYIPFGSRKSIYGKSSLQAHA